MRSIQIVTGVVIALAFAGAGFFAGIGVAGARSTSEASATTAPGRAGAASGARAGGAAQAAQAVSGRIISVNEGSITIALRAPGQTGASPAPETTTQIVLIGSATRIVRTSETDIKTSDLKAGDQITVVGTADAAGTLSATAIVSGATNVLGQLLGGAAGGGFGGGPGGASGRPTPSPSPTR